MRGVRCQRCNKMFSLSRDLVLAALEEMEGQAEEYYTVECPNCRRVVKVPRRDLERMRPREVREER